MCLLEIDDPNLLIRYPILADAIYNMFYQHISISRHNIYSENNDRFCVHQYS